MPRSKASQRVKAVGSKAQVFKGLARHTSGGLKKADIVRKKVGNSYRYVSKKKSKKGKSHPWIKAVMAARRELGIKGMAFPKKGTKLYALAKKKMR